MNPNLIIRTRSFRVFTHFAYFAAQPIKVDNKFQKYARLKYSCGFRWLLLTSGENEKDVGWGAAGFEADEVLLAFPAVGGTAGV